jgi:hypothetical protein
MRKIPMRGQTLITNEKNNVRDVATLHPNPSTTLDFHNQPDHIPSVTLIFRNPSEIHILSTTLSLLNREFLPLESFHLQASMMSST